MMEIGVVQVKTPGHFSSEPDYLIAGDGCT